MPVFRDDSRGPRSGETMNIGSTFLKILLAIVGLAVSLAVTVLGLFPMGPVGLVIAVGGAIVWLISQDATARRAALWTMATGVIMASGPLFFLSVAISR